MAYDSYNSLRPIGTGSICAAGADMRANHKAIFDYIAVGCVYPGDAVAVTGTAEEPATITYSWGTERLKETVTWLAGRPVSVLYERSDDSGSTWDEIGTRQIVHTSFGHANHSTWDAGSGYTDIDPDNPATTQTGPVAMVSFIANQEAILDAVIMCAVPHWSFFATPASGEFTEITYWDASIAEQVKIEAAYTNGFPTLRVYSRSSDSGATWTEAGRCVIEYENDFIVRTTWTLGTSYDFFDPHNPDAVTQDGPDFIGSTNNNQLALADAIMWGTVPGWNYSIILGGADLPNRVRYVNSADTDQQIKIHFGYNTSMNPETISYLRSSDGGATWETMGAKTITWDADQGITAITWS